MKQNSKEFTNIQIAELLRDIAASYQLQDDKKNRFKIIAYDRAADAVEHASSELKDLWDEGKLKDVPGIGESIAMHLDELFRTGKVKHFDEVMKNLPKQIFTLMKLPGIGPKTAFKIVKELKLENSKDIIKDVKKAAKEGKIAQIEGFGEGSQSEILKTTEESKEKTRRYLLPYAEERAEEIISWLKGCKEAKSIDPLGSLRRKASTIGDIDIAVSSNEPLKVIEHFVKFPKKQRILEKGERTASIILPGDVQVDLMVQEPESYGSLLQHFTGSKHHNIALREYALRKGLSLSEYGIKTHGKSEVKKFSEEKSFYNFLDLEYIPPELREDTGEIEAALEHKLPKLVELNDIKSDLHLHSNFDIETSHDLGISSFDEIIKEGESLNYEYLAFTEHNPSHGKHSADKILDLLKRKKEKVDKINYSIVKTVKSRIHKVFNSLEIDILQDGSCPIPLKGFDHLDFALVSIHSSFRLPKDQMTKRVLEALSWHPKIKVFAHPTARKLEEREGIELDWQRIFDYCKRNNKWLEINADPMRLDLPDFLVREVVKAGVKLTIGTDSHDKEMMENMIYGVSVARRGWAEKSDIINSCSLNEFEKLLIQS